MSLNKSGDIAGFQFSKAKLKNGNSTDHDKKIIPTTSFPDLDFLSLTIPLLFLFFVSMTLCLLNILKTSLLSSTRTVESQRKFESTLTTNIYIIEPSSVVPTHDDDVHGVCDSEFI